MITMHCGLMPQAVMQQVGTPDLFNGRDWHQICTYHCRLQFQLEYLSSACQYL